MPDGIATVPRPLNEPIKSYAPGTAERASLKKKLDSMLSKSVEVPLIIGGKEVRTGRTATSVCPHDHGHVLATYHKAGAAEVKKAVAASQEAWHDWSEMAWEARASVRPPRPRSPAAPRVRRRLCCSSRPSR